MESYELIPNQVLLHFANPERYTPAIMDTCFSADDSIIISTSHNVNMFGYDGDDGVWIWDSQTGRLIGLILFETAEFNLPYYMPLLEQQGAWLIQAEQKEVFRTTLHPQQHKIACKHRDHISIWEVKPGQDAMLSIEAWKQAKGQIEQAIINTEGFQTAYGPPKPLDNKLFSDDMPDSSLLWRPYSQHLLDINQGVAQLWDAESSTLIANYLKPNTYIVDACFNQDGSKLATISSDQTAQIWDVSSTLIIQEVQLAQSPWLLEWSMDDQHILIIYENDVFSQLWNITDDQLITLQSPIAKKTRSLLGSFIHAGRMLVSPNSHTSLELWNISPAQFQSVFELKKEQVTQFRLEHLHDPNIFNLTGLINWEYPHWDITGIAGSHKGTKVVICDQFFAAWICDIPNRGDSACESGSEA